MYGTTYIVRPFIEPLNKSPRIFLASDGAIQLLVGPAFSRSRVQMKVTFSVRETSLGSLRCRKQFGYVFGLSGRVWPSRTACCWMRAYSSSDPSHHTIRSGRVMRVTDSTHCSSGVDTKPPEEIAAAYQRGT